MQDRQSASEALSEQRRRNAQSQGDWETFAPHRVRVTRLLLDAAKGRESPSLCLLGAGNLNDVEMAALVPAYARIHLVDYDGDALAQGLKRQGLAGDAAIGLHGDVELSGLAAVPPDTPLEARIEAAERAALPPGIGPIEVVASLCVLSQLLEIAAEPPPVSKMGGWKGSGVDGGNTPSRMEGPRPPTTPDPVMADAERMLPLVQAVRLRHLRQMTELLAPGGEAILVTDCVSSDTVPSLQTVSDAELSSLLSRCIQQRNFFTGLNPAVLIDLLRHDPAFKDRVTGVVPVGPWRWPLGPRTYAVYGLRWTRRATVDSPHGT